MFYLMFEAIPKEGTPNAASYGGAYVNCWVDRPTLLQADKVARRMIEENEWIVNGREDAFAVDRSTYEENVVGLRYYEQALIDKEVLVYHFHPITDQE